MDDRDRYELEPVEQRLRRERGELSGIELDRIKTGVLAKAAREGGGGMALKSRLALTLIVVGLVGTGGGAVIAASGGSSSNGSSANSQYCPPSSPGAGKPKGGPGGNKCGHCPEDGSSDKKKCDCDDSSQAGDNGNGKDKGKGKDDKDKCKKGGK
jgi:hypothetical protein